MPTQEGVTTPNDTDSIDSLNAWLTSIVSSLLLTKPVKTVTSLEQLDGTNAPNGNLAIVTADSAGLGTGSVWARSSGYWRLVAGAQVLDDPTFIAALGDHSSLQTVRGTTYYEISTGEIRVWTNAAGTSRPVLDRAWTDIDYSAGTGADDLGYAFGYKLVAGGALLRGAVHRNNGNFDEDGVIAVLPEDIRPIARVRPMLLQGEGTALGKVFISTDGTVTLQNAINAGSSWYSLDGVIVPLPNLV
jgi:hypothetical protein